MYLKSYYSYLVIIHPKYTVGLSVMCSLNVDNIMYVYAAFCMVVILFGVLFLVFVHRRPGYVWIREPPDKQL